MVGVVQLFLETLLHVVFSSYCCSSLRSGVFGQIWLLII